ncbi:MAG: hypothetical protein DSY46_04180 [Hydrogenimonas sp.]|nr:MAG: hypothetical protein DSY46_04180 [Hydrogenimonas sp.]
MRFLIFLLLNYLVLFSAELHFKLYKLTGKEKGPTLLVFGGIHGNEPGGYFAPALLVTHYHIDKGALWVAPNLNFDSIIRFQRGRYGDMNRKFSTIAKNDPDKEIIEDIKALILNDQVDLILNLHDGHGFYRDKWQNSIFNPKAWGQACIIDQKSIDAKRFGDLDKLARQVSKRLNKKLLYQHHIFNVKNTETKMKDEQMRLSLTYFAITHGKPAMAIETSKNLTDVSQKVLYQLRAIEAFMDEIGISYHRDFDMNLQTIRTLLHHYGTVVINDNFLVPLDTVDKLLRFVPLKKRGNHITYADSPLAAIKKSGRYYHVMIGPWKITTLQPDYFTMKERLPSVEIEADEEIKKVKIPSIFEFRESFRVHAPKGYRVNIIGFSKKGKSNENNMTITFHDLNPRYAMDKHNRLFRVEFYHNNQFCGMTIAKKVDP